MACTSSPMPGAITTSVVCGGARDLQLVLPDADRLDEDDVGAAGVEHAHDVPRAERESPPR